MPLIVTSNRRDLGGRRAATILDCAPAANIPPFACCLSPANPLFVGASYPSPWAVRRPLRRVRPSRLERGCSRR